jgi:hypothetical protein
VTRTFVAAMRRANRLMRPAGLLTPARLTTATRSIQTAMTDLMVSTAMAPMTALTPTTPKLRKAAVADFPKPKPKPKARLKPKAGRTLSAVLTRLRAGQAAVPRLMGGASPSGPPLRPSSRKVPGIWPVPTAAQPDHGATSCICLPAAPVSPRV